MRAWIYGNTYRNTLLLKLPVALSGGISEKVAPVKSSQFFRYRWGSDKHQVHFLPNMHFFNLGFFEVGYKLFSGMIAIKRVCGETRFELQDYRFYRLQD